MLVPHLLTDIYIDVNPSVGEGELDKIIKDEEEIDGSTDINFTYKLNISHDLLNGCEYILTWRVSYSNDGLKEAWIDAQTGEVIKNIDAMSDLKAPIETTSYSTYQEGAYVDLNDYTSGGKTYLQISDGSLKVYDSGSCDEFSSLPSTTNQYSWGLEATPHAYQTFYVFDHVMSFFKQMNIDFNGVKVATCTDDKADSNPKNTMSSSTFRLGKANYAGASATYSLYDVVAHELAHTYMYQFLDTDEKGNKSLHEAIADMYGTYIEYRIQNNSADWVIGDDEPITAARIHRDLANPNYSCFTNVQNEDEPHDRGEPLGHWFYLIAHGSSANDIPALGINKAIKIVGDALKVCGKKYDYPQFREATLGIVFKNYNKCSNETKAVINAWHEICVGPSFENCTFEITGNTYHPCEEWASFTLCVQPAFPPHIKYQWRVVGPGCSEWKLDGHNGCTAYDVGGCIQFTDWPKYNYYPKYFTIEAYSPELGYKAKKQIILTDCNHDDPTCEEFYGSQILKTENNQFREKREVASIKIFDIMGNILYNGPVIDVNNNTFTQYSGLLFIAGFDESNKLIKIDKVLNFERFK